MADDKRIESVIDAAVRRFAREELHTMRPGVVTAVNLVGGQVRSVNVQPLVKTRNTDEDGETVVRRMPVINNVPIQQPGAGGFRATFPVAVGDTVMLGFCEVSIDTWLATGAETEPEFTHTHNITDAVAFLGFNDFAHGLASAPTDRMTLGKDGGTQIQITPTQVLLGGDEGAASQSAVLGDILDLFLQQLRTAIAAHTHPVAGAVAGVSAQVWPTVPTITSDVVRVKP